MRRHGETAFRVVNEGARVRSGIFLVAAWREGGGDPTVRARVTYTEDTAAIPQTVTATASVDDACLLLRQWWSAVGDE